jgi:hypothetical protein
MHVQHQNVVIEDVQTPLQYLCTSTYHLKLAVGPLTLVWGCQEGFYMFNFFEIWTFGN